MMEPRSLNEEDLDGLLSSMALDDEAGPARPLSEIQAASLVRGAFVAHAAQRQTLDGTSAPEVRRPSTLRQRAPWQLGVAATALVLVVAVAVAALRHHQAPPPPVPAAAPALAGASPAALVPERAPEPPPVVLPVAPAPPEAPPRLRTRSPEDLLRLANERRRARRYQEADAVYQQVVRADGRGDAAYVARVASAALRLEHLGDARGAAVLYRAALRSRPHSALADEARRGLAEAYHALGEAAAERQALHDLLSAQPDAATRSWAEGRLRGLPPATER